MSTDAREVKVENTKKFFAQQSVVYWRQLAIEAQERIKILSAQLEDVRKSADDNRARMTKYKGRLENAQDTANNLQARLIAVSAERDVLRDAVAKQDIVKRKVYEFRQSILEGPLWELFAEFCREVDPEKSADQGAKS